MEISSVHDVSDFRWPSHLIPVFTRLHREHSETYAHSERVSKLAVRLGKTLGLSKDMLKILYCAGWLHDIGKVSIRLSIMQKSGALTPREWQSVRLHPSLGASFLSTLSVPDQIVALVRYHHERWDGRGYPMGRAGETIPFGARILAVADAFDAMTNDRPYRKALSTQVALSELERNVSKQFDPEVVAPWLQMVRHKQITPSSRTQLFVTPHIRPLASLFAH